MRDIEDIVTLVNEKRILESYKVLKIFCVYNTQRTERCN